MGTITVKIYRPQNIVMCSGNKKIFLTNIKCSLLQNCLQCKMKITFFTNVYTVLCFISHENGNINESIESNVFTLKNKQTIERVYWNNRNL